MTDTFSLKLLYGIPPAVGDPLSAEQGMEVIALASEVMRPAGFFMDEERPFFPQIAGLKNGGAWLDNPAEDGRHLQSEAKGNIVETIYVKLAGDVTQRYHYLSALSRFADEARRFHSTDYQTRPVQIEWWATGAPGPQWALVYNIDYAVQRPYNDAGTVFDVVITVEREPAWRGVMFGLPATVWTQYALGNDPGSDYTYADLSLVTGTALYQETVQNKHEFDGANGYTANFPPLSKNWIDIDAADIPGDAPALVTVTAHYDFLPDQTLFPASTGSLAHLLIARSTKPRTWQPKQGGEDRPQFYNLNAGDAAIQTGTKTTTTSPGQGVISNGSSTVMYRWTQTASATSQRLGWGVNITGAAYGLSHEALRGWFAVFVRGRTPSATPASFALQIAHHTGIVSGDQGTEITVIPAYTPAGASTYRTFYIGTFKLPIEAESWVDDSGAGLDIPDMDKANTDMGIRLVVTTASTSATEVIDVVLVPYDEGQIKVVNPNPITPPAGWEAGTLAFDNTGFLNRGKDGIAKLFDSPMDTPHFIGNSITLEPKKDNRLYFMGVRQSTADLSAIEEDLTIRVNIIPRWYGIRDK